MTPPAVHWPTTASSCVLKGGTTTSHIIYAETHATATNDFGLATVEIGNGTTTDTLANINWGDDDYYLMVEADTSGTGTNFEVMGTTQLLSLIHI